MNLTIAGKTVSVAALVAAVGGLVAIIGVPLAWMTVTVGTHTEELTGLDEDLLGGKIALILGLAVIAVVVLGILNVKIPQSGAILAALGLLIVVVVVLVYFTNLLSKESFVHTADQMKLAGGSASIGIGALLAALGGILAIVGGGLIHLKKA
jgi:hypothetical protein